MPTDESNPWDDPDAVPASPTTDAGPTLAKDAGEAADPPVADADADADAIAAATDAAPTDVPDAPDGDADRRRVLVIAAVAFIVIAAVAFVLTRGGDDDDTATNGSPTTSDQASAGDSPDAGGGAITIGGTSDSFNRDDSDAGLGALPSGAPWVVQSGGWAISSGEAVVAQPEAEKRNTVYVATGYPDPMAQVRLTTIANGAGMVFRYQGECNFWAIYAVPEFATWNIEKVVDCERVGAEEDSPVFRTITSAPVASGTTVGVVLSGDQVQIVLNGTIALTFDDPDLAGVGRVGLTTRGDDEVAFDDFVAGGPGGQGVVGSATPPADGEGGGEGDEPTTTTAPE